MFRKISSAMLLMVVAVALTFGAAGCDDLWGAPATSAWGYDTGPGYLDSPAYFNEYFDVFYPD